MTSVRKALAALGAVVTFVLATVLGVLLHLDVPAVKRVVASQVNALLDGTFRGDLEIREIGELGLDGVSGARIVVRDPEGVPVVSASGVRVDVRTAELVRSLLGKGPVHVPLPRVRIAHADIALDGDGEGQLRIANAFAAPADEKPPAPEEAAGPGVRIDAPKIALEHAWIHGTPPGVPFPIDAEVSDLEASGHVGPERIDAELEQAHVLARSMPRGLDPRGALDGTFSMQTGPGTEEKIAFAAGFHGAVGGMPTSLEASMDGPKVDASLDVRDASGERVSSIAPELDVDHAVSLHAEAHGALPRIAASVDLDVGAAEVDVEATVAVADTLAVDGTVRARDVNLAALLEDGPPSSLGLDGHAKVSFPPEGPRGEAEIDTVRGTLDGKTVPPMSIRAAVTKERGELHARVDEPSMRTELHATVSPVASPDPGKGRVVVANGQVAIPELAKVPVIGAAASGAARASASARVVLPEAELEGSVEATGRSLRVGGAQVDDVEATANVTGTLDEPVVDVSAKAEGLSLGEIGLQALEARARVVQTDAGLEVREPRIVASNGDMTMSAEATRLTAGGGALAVEDAVVGGIGEPVHVDLERDAGRLHARIDARRIDLGRLGRLVGQDRMLRAGAATIQGDVTLRRRGAEGRLHVAVDEAAIAELRDVNAAIDVRAEGDALDVAARADLGAAGRIALATRDLTIPGSPLSASSWRRATGVVDVESAVDLERAFALLPRGTLPVSAVAGDLVALGEIARRAPGSPPEVLVHAHTRGLRIATGDPSATAAGDVTTTSASPVRMRGTDLALDVRTDAPTGWTGVSARATDAEGAVIAFDAKARIPYDEILEAPQRARHALVRSPMNAKLLVPPRPLERLPALPGTRGFGGKVAAEVDVSGTPLDPRLHATFVADDLRAEEAPIRTTTDLEATVDYDGSAFVVSADAATQDGAKLGLVSRIDVRLGEVLEPPVGAPVDWTASARASLERFPLEAIAGVTGLALQGRVTGEAVLEGLNENARVRTELDLDGLEVGRVSYRTGRIVAVAGAGQLAGSVRLHEGGSSLNARVSGGLTWGAELTPALDESRAFEARLQAKRFRVGVLQPFVTGQLAALDGMLDADARFELDPSTHETRMDGRIALRDGSAHVVALGQELTDMRAVATLSPDGTIRVKDVFARTSQGQLEGSGSVHLEGLDVTKADAKVRIPKDRPIDFVVGGQPVGEVWGNASLVAVRTPADDTTTLSIDVPMLGVELPQNLKTGVQELEQREKIHVGYYRRDGKFEPLPLDREDAAIDDGERAEAPGAASRVVIDLNLRKVVVERGNTLELTLEGSPKVVLAEETSLTGSIQAVSGTIDIQGKEFEIEKATVTFTGESPPNPTVIATAAWTAADGTEVFADFNGPVKSGEVKLRSEPPRPDHEILALILFGTADGANPTPTPGSGGGTDATKTAVSLGGGFAAQGLTEAIDDLTGVQATARIDTTLPGNPRPEIEFQLSPTISIEFSRIIGTPPLFAPDRTLATFEWRFRRNWSVETTFGDRGTARLDALWQRRY